MKKLIGVVLAAAMVLSLAGTVMAAKPGTDFDGPHYNLNLIGKNKVMPGDYDNWDRHTMFVPESTEGMSIPLNTPNNLDQTSLPGIKINMTQGAEFAVIDGNATDGVGSFQLGPGRYSVYIAVKAKDPKSAGIVNITGWVQAYDNLGELWYYLNVGSVSVSKNKTWTDATHIFFVSDAEDPFGVITQDTWVFDYLNILSNVLVDLDGDGLLDDPQFTDLAYFWQLVNNGAKLIQVRFYSMS